MAKVKLITKSEFAKLMGVSAAAVTKAITEKRITTVTDGVKEKIDPAVAKIQWSQNTRARSPSVNASSAADASSSPGNGNNESGYWDSRSSREKAEAGIAQLKLEEMRRTLIPVAAVSAAFGNAFAALRESLMQLPSRMAAGLAAETDAQKIQNELSAAIHAALETLAKAPESLPTADTPA